MKEFQYKTGGRRLYNEDIARLQELALSMTSVFKDCDNNFVVSGCGVTKELSVEYSGRANITVSAGFVWFNGKMREVSAVSFSNAPANYIPAIRISNTINDEQIRYADGTSGPGYYDYGAEVIICDESEITSDMIVYDPITLRFPNMTDGFFSFYGLNNSDIIVDVSSVSSFDVSNANIFCIGNRSAESRVINSKAERLYILTEEEEEIGMLAFIEKDKLCRLLAAGVSKIGGFFPHSNIVIQFYVATDRYYSEADSSVISEIGSSISITRTDDIENDGYYYTIDDQMRALLNEAMNGSAIGVYMKLISGTVDSSDGFALINHETDYFGIISDSVPEQVYKFYNDGTGGTVFQSAGGIEWDSLSDYEKNLWKNCKFEKIETKSISIDSPKNESNRNGGIYIDGTTVDNQFIEISDSPNDDGDRNLVFITPTSITGRQSDAVPFKMDRNGIKCENIFADTLLDRDGNNSIAMTTILSFFASGISSMLRNGEIVIRQNDGDGEEWKLCKITPEGITFTRRDIASLFSISTNNGLWTTEKIHVEGGIEVTGGTGQTRNIEIMDADNVRRTLKFYDGILIEVV